MKYLKILFILNFLLFTKISFATAQTPDYLIIEKDTLKLHCNPLNSYFEENPLPENLNRIVSTGLWRGYIAFFKIINSKLMVENIYKIEYYEDADGTSNERLISIYEIAFKGIKNYECNFYSGVLICPLGEIKEYIHMGYSSIYENYHLYEFKDGLLQKEKKLTNDEFIELKIKHFQKFKKSDEYKIQFDELLKATKESEKEMENMIEELSDKDKKRKKQNKYLYEKEKEVENIKMTDNFLFFFITDNIKTIDITD